MVRVPGNNSPAAPIPRSGFVHGSIAAEWLTRSQRPLCSQRSLTGHSASGHCPSVSWFAGIPISPGRWWPKGRIVVGHSVYDPSFKDRRPWNAGRKPGAKRPLKLQQVWAIRFWLDGERRLRDRALLDLAIDSKLRGCDVVKVKIGDLVSGGRVRSRAIVVQQKTGRPVHFGLLNSARSSMSAWLERRGGTLDDFVFPSRIDHADHISTRQYRPAC